MEENYILHKYLNGEASKNEIALLKKDPEFAVYLKIAETSENFEAPDFDSHKNFNKISTQIFPKVKKLSTLHQFMRVAAVLAILFVGYLFISNLETNIHTDIAENTNITLPDGSEVTLNALSKIRYHKKKWEENRNLSMEGEAFFKVAKGTQFDVNTSHGTVSVLGTQFNVYARDNTLKVACFEGKVQVAYKDTIVYIPAGENLKIKDGVLLEHSYDSTDTFPSWIANESSFENTSLTDVIAELERQYHIKVSFDSLDTSRKFTGAFTHTNLTIALQSICNPLQLRYIIDDESQITIYDPKRK